MPEILATLHPSPARRVMGIGSLTVFGGLLMTIAVMRPPADLGGQAFLLGLGAGALYLSWRMLKATTGRLELTADVLRDSKGSVLAHVADIRSVERGTFAFKPSSGFMLRLEAPGTRAWAPGLWWRLGRSVGVGGVTGSSEGKYMAEVIAALLSERR
jgi:hypothetical protein